jgi:hypothetical protein
MNIVIFGLAKSGTTALYYKIKQSLPPETVCLFEPHAFDAAAIPQGLSVLAKILPFRIVHPADAGSFANFEKQILIVRDPRDRLISRLLYNVYHAEFCDDEQKVSVLRQLLERKESDSRAVPVHELMAVIAELNGQLFSLDEWANSYRQHSIKRPLDFHEQNPAVFLYKYEDMIDGRLHELEEYLQLKLEHATVVDPEVNRVTRTKTYGDWRNWFTPTDVDHMRPVLQPYLDRYYPDADWELNPAQTISAEHASLYIERLVNERRALNQLLSA